MRFTLLDKHFCWDLILLYETLIASQIYKRNGKYLTRLSILCLLLLLLCASVILCHVGVLSCLLRYFLVLWHGSSFFFLLCCPLSSFFLLCCPLLSFHFLISFFVFLCHPFSSYDVFYQLSTFLFFFPPLLFFVILSNHLLSFGI